MKLPSRFQIDDTVRVGKYSGVVKAVTFEESKVFYQVLTSKGLIGPVDSCEVSKPLCVIKNEVI